MDRREQWAAMDRADGIVPRVWASGPYAPRLILVPQAPLGTIGGGCKYWNQCGGDSCRRCPEIGRGRA